MMKRILKGLVFVALLLAVFSTGTYGSGSDS